MGLVNGRGRFSTPTAPRPLGRFSWNLKYIAISRTRLRTQTFRGLCRRGWSEQIATLTHESFCPSFPFLVTPTGRIFGHIPTLNTSLCVVPAKEVPFGGQKDEIWNLTSFTPQKNVKIGTLSWRSMENCSRPNSGTVNRILFKLGTVIAPPPMASRDMTPKSKGQRSR